MNSQTLLHGGINLNEERDWERKEESTAFWRSTTCQVSNILPN